jgi:catechol 2,3-dioxygenase-like lactoylglutathione lyase family enzyme
MTNLNLIVLYVESATESAIFYEAITGREAVSQSPNFASLALENGPTLGLWSRSQVVPKPADTGARSEIGFMVKGRPAIEALYVDWQARGLKIEQEMAVRDFGPTFVALDPDGHRLRVCLFDE